MAKEHIEAAIVNAVNGDNVEFLDNIKQAIYDELSNNDEFNELQSELDKYSSMITINKEPDENED